MSADEKRLSLTRRQFVNTAALATATTALSPLFAFDRTFAGSVWLAVPFGKISVGGDLAKRTEQNWRRLQDPAYSVPAIFANETIESWPGDWVSRTLLADILLARSTGRDESAAAQIIRALPAHLNKAGYFGEVIDANALNEQQLGDSHAWLFRALYEYYVWTRDSGAREMFDTLVRKMALPMKDWWESYPITPDARERGKGGVNGNGQWRYGRWFLSSDVGNQFMVLDGLTQAWALDRSAELKAAIDPGIERFLKMDPITLQAQTHATLTTCRALLRMHALTGENALLEAVRQRYEIYRTVAMTESYANYNWFDRPDTWTEPCAVIDAFIIAMQLWEFTGHAQYLEDAHLIWFNGVGRGQRATGGFGCDSCAGAGDPFLGMKLVYEATFCCTMRGGEGHSHAIQAAYHTRPGDLAVTFYTDSRADLDVGNGRVVLEQSTQYPYAGDVRFKVISSTITKPITLRLFAPAWLAGPRLTLHGQPLASRMEAGFLVTKFTPRAGDRLSFDSTVRSWVRPTRNPHSIQGYQAFHAGPLMLGHQGAKEIFLSDTAELIAESPGRFQVRGKDVTLTRINDLNDGPSPSRDPLDPTLTEAERIQLQGALVAASPSYRRQVLFRKS